MTTVEGHNERRNFLLNIAEGGLYISSGAFLSIQTVLPALVSRLGGTNVAVGAIGLIAYVGLFLPQLFAARTVETLPWKKPWTVRFGLMQRFVILLLGFVILAFGDGHPALALWFFLILYLANQMLAGVTTPAWFDLFAKITASNRRGRLVGIRSSVGGAGAFLGGLVLTWLLSAVHFPLSYALVFFLAFLLQLSSAVVQTRFIEAEASVVVAPRPMFAFLRELPTVLRRNTEFRRFIASSAVLIVATMPSAFFTVYALRRFNAEESVIGQFTLTMVATQVVSAFVNGYIADHFGNKRALIVAAAGMLCASVWALLAPSLGWFLLVYVFLGVNLGTEVITRYNLSIEYGPVAQRSTYIGLMNTVLAPFYVSSVIGGLVSDAFGYGALFGAGIVFSSVGLYLLIAQVRDPRARPVSAPA